MAAEIWKRIDDLSKLAAQCSNVNVTSEVLGHEGLLQLVPRDYQVDGVNWLLKCHSNGHGCILGDDMGLGKTLQSIAFLLHLHVSRKERTVKGPFLVLSPLSVASYWEEEFKRLTPSLRVLRYGGQKEEREELRSELSSQTSDWRFVQSRPFDVFVSTYEMSLKDKDFLKRIPWHCLIVDEGHRAKNADSLFSQTLRNEYDISMTVLLSGTPIQNNLTELYSLLHFVAPDVFELRWLEDFVEKFVGIEDDPSKQARLHCLLNPFLLRRCKADVLKELPQKSEVILYCGLTELQKKLYKAILMKDVGIFGEHASKTRLLNVMMQLRKCCNHPYIFNGVEPEPFEQGEHLVTASGKLFLIDQLLSHLKQGGHRVLLFSQMTRMLDILQDFLEYRGYCYERLDGSVRSEERYLAIKNFSEMDESFVFLLSTRAGGLGLNLTAADTVIYADLDFNPHSDLQAAARTYRIGQNRPVKIIRLVTKSTVEEIIMRRADAKLKLTNVIIEGGHFTHDSSASGASVESPVQLADMLKFGLDQLLSSDASVLDDGEWKRMLGRSEDGRWCVSKDEQNEGQTEAEEAMETEKNADDNMYLYEGHDYSTVLAADNEALQKLLADSMIQQTQMDERVLRNEIKVPVAAAGLAGSSRKRKQLTEEELAARRQKRKEAAEKRAKLAEEEQRQREERRRHRLEEFWQREGYQSCNISLESEESEEETEDDLLTSLDDEDNDKRNTRNIQFVLGDVTHPKNTGDNDAIIVHCVDDGGRWGRGGLFTAISARSMQPQSQYDMAFKMRDLSLGDCHVISVDDLISRDSGSDLVALIVAQRRGRHNQVSAVKLPALEEGLQRVAQEAKKRKASVHLPRIGYSTPDFNWYGTERLIRKRLASHGIPTFVYYFSRQSRRNVVTRPPSVSVSAATGHAGDNQESGTVDASDSEGDEVQTVSEGGSMKKEHDAKCLNGVTVFLHGLDEEKRKRLEVDVVAFGGDVSTSLGPGVSHVVCAGDGQLPQEIETLDLTAVPVSSLWLEECIRRSCVVSVADYIVMSE